MKVNGSYDKKLAKLQIGLFSCSKQPTVDVDVDVDVDIDAGSIAGASTRAGTTNATAAVVVALTETLKGESGVGGGCDCGTSGKWRECACMSST